MTNTTTTPTAASAHARELVAVLCDEAVLHGRYQVFDETQGPVEGWKMDMASENQSAARDALLAYIAKLERQVSEVKLDQFADESGLNRYRPPRDYAAPVSGVADAKLERDQCAQMLARIKGQLRHRRNSASDDWKQRVQVQRDLARQRMEFLDNYLAIAATPPPADSDDRLHGIDHVNEAIDALLNEAGPSGSLTIIRHDPSPNGCTHTVEYHGKPADWIGVGTDAVQALDDLYYDLFLK